jgi:hypothetical protein
MKTDNKTAISQLVQERERLVEETKSYVDLPGDATLSHEQLDRLIEELRAIRLRIHAIDELLRTAESKNSVPLGEGSPMNPGYDISDLEKYARNQINAQHFLEAVHRFRLLRCAGCGALPLALTVEHHSGSRKGNFRGIIYGECKECGEKDPIYSFTGSHRELVQVENPLCNCGHGYFLVAELERFEGEDGLAGFFDEGVVVGKCADCNRNRLIVATD